MGEGNLAGEPGGAGRLQNSPKPAATPGEGLTTSAALPHASY